MKKSKNFLDYIPYISDKNKWDEKDMIVTIHMEHRGFYHRLAQLVFKTPKISHIALDQYGSFVWKHIDGNNTVYDIATAIKEKYGNDAEPLYERLVKFIKILKNNRFIFLKQAK